MSKYSIEDTTLATIGDAIRAKRNITNQMTPSEMATEISKITGGVTPTGTIEITENGTYDVTEYASADVSIPTLVFNSQGFANDSWELIAQISEAGLAPYYYNIGDTKTISFKDNGSSGAPFNNYLSNDYWYGDLKVVIVGFNIYENGQDPTKKNGIVLAKFGYRHNVWHTGYYGWVGGSDTNSIRAFLNNSFFNALPDDLQAVVKPSRIMSKNNYSKTVVKQNYKVFIPSLKEIGWKESDTKSSDMNEVQALPFFTDYKYDQYLNYNNASYLYYWHTQSDQPRIALRSMEADGLTDAIVLDESYFTNRFSSTAKNYQNCIYKTAGYGSSHPVSLAIILLCV